MKRYVWLIFALTVGIRLYFAFQTPHFTDDEAYFVLRQVDEIKNTGTPVYQDSLSFGGRTYIFLPLYYYILAFFSLFFKTTIVAKVIPNIMASSLVFIIYFIVRSVKDEKAALLCAFVAGFIPVYWTKTVNTASSMAMVIPLLFLLIYYLQNLRIKKNIYLYLITLCCLTATSPQVILIVLAMVLFLLLSWVEGFKLTKSEIELTLFSLFFVTWFFLLFFKEALSMHGVSIIWQNIPSEVLVQYFSDVKILETIYQIGVIPLLLGVWVVYVYTFRKKKKSVYRMMSILLIIVILLLQKYVELSLGLIYVGVVLTILLGEFLVMAFDYLDKTKFSGYRNVLLIFFLAIFIGTSFVPTIIYMQRQESDTDEKVKALDFLKEISEPGDTIVGSVFDGHLIAYTAERRNIIDSNFLLVDSEARLSDLRTLYTSALESKAIELMHKYNADFIVVTGEAKRFYNITRIAYADTECFPLVYAGAIEVYELRC